jgi:hypothetical protein
LKNDGRAVVSLALSAYLYVGGNSVRTRTTVGRDIQFEFLPDTKREGRIVAISRFDVLSVERLLLVLRFALDLVD